MDIITIKRIIAAPIDEVWAITSSFGAIRAWMPAVEACGVEGAGLGSLRTVRLKGGAIARERLDVVDPLRHRVRYAIVTPGMVPAKGLIGGTELRTVDAQTTELTWSVTADELQGDLDAVLARLGPFIVSNIEGLGNLLKVAVRAP